MGIGAGDILQLKDWRLHVTAVDRERTTAVLTAELGFLLHFTQGDVVDVVTGWDRAAAA